MISVKYMDDEYTRRDFPDDTEKYCLAVISGETEEVLSIANTLRESWSARRHDNTTDCYIELNSISDFLDIVIEVNNYVNCLKGDEK